jgi:hypothetical protein
MRTRVGLLLGVIVSAVVTVGVLAQEKPNFSGEWTLVPEKSDFGPMAAPTTLTRTITHADPALKIVVVQGGAAVGDSTVTLNLSTDGKPHTNDVTGNSMTTTGKWDGSAIVLTSVLSMQGTNIHVEDRLEMSDAGKTLTMTRRFQTPEGEASSRVVMKKTK